MILKNLRIEKDKTSKLCMDVEYNKKITTLWYETENEFSNYLCDELADSFLVVLLLFAMEHDEDIIIEGSPVTASLLFNIKNYLIPSISKNTKKYKKICIKSETANIIYKNNNHNGTGISRGIDSFCTLEEFTNECPDEMKIDILTFFNIGAHGEYDSKSAYQLFLTRMKESKKFAEENHFKFLTVNTNISDFLMQNFEATHTFRNLSIVFALQKLFKNYYYSSGISIDNFSFSEEDTACYDVYILYLLSTNNVKFISSGTNLSRLEKTKKVAQFTPSYDNLSVCFLDSCNCGRCEKCIRTIFEFYSANNLEKYANSFDLNDFYKNFNYYETRFFEFYYRLNKNTFYTDIYNEMKKNKIKIHKINMIKGYLLSILKRIYYFIRRK